MAKLRTYLMFEKMAVALKIPVNLTEQGIVSAEDHRHKATFTIEGVKLEARYAMQLANYTTITGIKKNLGRLKQMVDVVWMTEEYIKKFFESRQLILDVWEQSIGKYTIPKKYTAPKNPKKITIEIKPQSEGIIKIKRKKW